MTDKQIIIKDYFNIMRDENGRIYCIQDIGDPKSLIKAIREQNEYIQAKEQECKKLKEDRERWKSNFNGKVSAIEELLQQLDQLRAKNEELKKRVCGLRPELKYIINKTCCKYNINAKYYHEKIVEIINNLDKYKQTLAEIEEIAKEQIPYLDTDISKTMKEVKYDYVDKIYILEQRMHKILQKISKCEAE